MFAELLTFSQVKEEPYIIEHILWDTEPKDLMEPRCRTSPEGTQIRKPIKGYLFYIDTMDREPSLFLMRHTAAEYGETLAQISEVPGEFLKEAVEENKAREYFGMYPINKKIQGWLRKELGIGE